jgi:predicted metal-dependent hydrolase
MIETLVTGDLEFEVRRSQRRRTLGLTVDRFGELIVHAPSSTESQHLQSWVDKKLLWVHRKLLLKDDGGARSKRLHPVSGETISYLGHNYRLRLVEKQEHPLIFDGHWFKLRKADRINVSRHFQRWYEDAGIEWLTKRITLWQRKTGTGPMRIKVSTLGFRWASCGKDRTLRFNWQLLQLPPGLIDYVIVHELIHLREHNHTPEFWRSLGAVLPDWQTRKEELSAMTSGVNWSTALNSDQ